MSDIRRYGSSGIHTVEGNVAGTLAAQFAREREKQEKEYADKKKQIEQENARASRIDKNFESHTDAASEAEFKRQTVGLVTAAEFRKRRENCMLMNDEKDDEADELQPAKRAKPAPKKKKSKPLSFSMDSEDEEAAKPVAKKKIKCPFVETAFLPDKEREEEIAREKTRLAKEWHEEQERIKNENVNVAFSYWDGIGHRQNLTVTKRTTIRQFLDAVRQSLLKSFPALRGVSVDNLLYIKEDLIIPHHLSFYDLIVTQARGKSGPLFHFGIRRDLRPVNDVRVEKEDSHAGKVTLRAWYEKHKHIFPASRWELYAPAVPRDSPYSLRD
ncbi:Aste57867_13229 [Aphanomyces stellatus]|uniref:Aste57867_13229 protein n=1 Tax=Aphanomyces stellatus TaxID=120398 RepID=A0A485KZA1_9STRA|nr:hypothetical protein As57867_013180 [Aphanomyces stellatus]VFT90069.1 Aste57867_13229 [Aphanomyces stellatus]